MEVLRKCNICEREVINKEDLHLFKKSSKGKHGRDNYCKTCYSKGRKDSKKQWRAKNPEKNKSLIKRSQVKNTYGISLEEYESCMQTSLVCEVCGRNENLCYDHSHITGKFRGVLCNKCNTAAGMLNDKASEAYKLFIYLVDRGD